MNNETTPQKKEAMKHVEWWFLFAILIMIVVTIFALSNASPAPVRFFIWTFELSLALLIFISAAIGAVIAIILGLMKRLSNRKRFKLLEKQVASLEKEKAALEIRLAEMEALHHKSQPGTVVGSTTEPIEPVEKQEEYPPTQTREAD